jgi:hypothetical protein
MFSVYGLCSFATFHTVGADVIIYILVNTYYVFGGTRNNFLITFITPKFFPQNFTEPYFMVCGGGGVFAPFDGVATLKCSKSHGI